MKMKHTPPPYQPVSCVLYDQVEVFATFRTEVKLVVETETGQETIVGVIVDVNTRKDGEYLKLEKGREIRLDQVRSLARLGA